MTGATPRGDSIRREVGKRLRVERFPATRVVAVSMTGSYDRHPEAFAALARFARAAGWEGSGGNPVGVYPTDPDAVGAPFPSDSGVRANERGQSGAELATALRWELAMPVPDGVSDTAAARAAAPPIRLTAFPATDAVTLETTAGRAPVDGLALGVWLLEHGYVQTAPTRMEYITQRGGGRPTELRTRIIIPVARRRSGLTLR